MAEDIVPGMMDKLTSDFQKSFQTDSALVSLYAKVSDGTADQKDGEAFAQRLGQVLTDTFHNNVTPEQLPDGRMYYNIASRLITPMLETNHGLVNEVMRQIISKQNADAGIGLRYQDVDFDKDKAHGLVERAANYPKYEVVQNDVETGLTTFTQGVADEAVRKNASFQASAGLHPRIIRETDGDCCKWCLDLAGTYDYESAPPEVYARHANCGCSVEFRPGDGKRQDVWSKALISDMEFAKIESRKEFVGIGDDKSTEKVESRKMSNFSFSREHSESSRNYFEGAEPRVVSREERIEIARYAKEKGVTFQKPKYFEGDPEVLKSGIDTIAKWLDIMPSNGEIILKVGYLGTKDFAETHRNIITINTMALMSRDITERAINEDPIRYASKTLEDIFAHEYAHAYEFNASLEASDSIEIARRTCDIIGFSGSFVEYFYEHVSTYSVDKGRAPLGCELNSEVFAKHNNAPDEFTTTYLGLMDERRRHS